MNVPCQHLDFHAQVAVARLADDDRPLRFRADVTVWCAACEQKFMFEGVDFIGYKQAGPSLDVSRTELSIPIAPWDGDVMPFAHYEVTAPQQDAHAEGEG